MSGGLRKPMTLAEVLDWENRQPVRYEFDRFGPVATAGGTLEQGLIQADLIRAHGLAWIGRSHGRAGRFAQVAVTSSG
jgi:hypothetical protein